MEEFYHKLYNLENYIIYDVRNRFNENGYIESFDFFCIIIWKANRAKSKIAKKLLTFNPNLNECIKELTRKVFNEPNLKNKLKILIVDYKLRLPVASAILSILYPDYFTIFDIRVCDTFPEFKGIDNLQFENLWIRYEEFIIKVSRYGSNNYSLREKDRILWGKSFFEQLNLDLNNNFGLKTKKNNYESRNSIQ